MSQEMNKALAKRYFEEFLNQGNLSVADEILDTKVAYSGRLGQLMASTA